MILVVFSILILVLFCRVIFLYTTSTLGIPTDRFARCILKNFFKKVASFSLFITLAEMLVTAFYPYLGFPFLLPVILVFVSDFIFTLQSYRVVNIFRTFMLAMGKRRNFYVHVGIWYVAMKIRDIFLFVYPARKWHLIILFECELERAKRGLLSLLGVHVRGSCLLYTSPSPRDRG